MTNNDDQKNNPAGKIEYYFLRKSVENFSADLNNFAKEVAMPPFFKTLSPS